MTKKQMDDVLVTIIGLLSGGIAVVAMSLILVIVGGVV